MQAPVCPNCSKIYGTSDPSRPYGPRLPLLLSCGHTFCEGCISLWAKRDKNNISCPACQQKTSLPENSEKGVKSLTPDIYTLGLLSVNRWRANTAHNSMFPSGVSRMYSSGSSSKRFNMESISLLPQSRCSECNSKAASCKCLNCDQIMCGLCFDTIHTGAKALIKHQAMPLLEDRDGIYLDSMKCTKHDKPIEYYCDDDQAPICSRCLIDNHRPHTTMSMQEKNQSIVGEIEPAMKATNQIMNQLRKSDKNLDHGKNQLKIQVANIMEMVHKIFRELHCGLQSREQNLNKELTTVLMSQTQEIDQTKQHIWDTLHKLEFLIRDAKLVVNTAHQTALNGTEVLKKLNDAQSLPCCIQVTREEGNENPALGINLDDFVSLQSSIKTFGKVHAITSSLLTLKSISEVDPAQLDTVTDSDSLSNADARAMLSDSVLSEQDSDVIVESESEESQSPRSPHMSLTDPVANSIMQQRPKSKLLKRYPGSFIKQELVKVIFITNPHQFWVQKVSDTERLNSMSRAINRLCKSHQGQYDAMHIVQKDDLVMCRYTMDNQWYRARVLDVEARSKGGESLVMVEVYYIDYGNTETTPVANIRKLSRYTDVHDYAIQCSLKDIVPANKQKRWSPEATRLFVKMTDDKPVLMSIQSVKDKVMIVDLCKPQNDDIDDDRPISLRDAFVFLGLACFISMESVNLPDVVKQPRRSYIRLGEIRVKEVFTGFMSHVESPDMLYVNRINEETEYLSNIVNSMQKTYTRDTGDLYTIYCPQPGMPCVARYINDSRWYRGEVVACTGYRMIKVRYVDFGNTDILEYTQIKKILNNYMILPAQAIKCRLIDIEPIDLALGWSEEAKTKVSQYIFSPSVIKAVEVENDMVAIVLSLSKQGPTLNGLLVSENMAKSTGIHSAPSSAENMDFDDKMTVVSSQMPDISFITSEADSDTDSFVTSISRSGYQSCKDLSFDQSQSPPKSAKEVKKTQTEENAREKVENSESSSYMQIKVKVVHVVNPTQLYVHLLTAGEDGLDTCNTNLYKAYTCTQPLIDVKFEAGSSCAAKYSKTGEWYRAKIIEVVNNKASVFMTDYGYEDVVFTDDLRLLDEDMTTAGSFALCCHLVCIQPAGGAKWSRTACERLDEFVKDKQFKLMMKGNQVDDSLPVTLIYERLIEGDALSPDSIEDINLSRWLVEEGLALPMKKKPMTTSELSLPGKQAKEPHISLSKAMAPSVPAMIGSNKISLLERKQTIDSSCVFVKFPGPIIPDIVTFEAIPTYVDFQGTIYAQEVSNEGSALIEHITYTLICEFVNSQPGLRQAWEIGQACIAQFSQDSMWYRGKVEDVSKGVKVKFIDYGNSEIVPHEHLRRQVTLTDIPQQCLELTLEGVVPMSTDYKWPTDVLGYIHELVVNEKCTIHVKEPLNQGKLGVSITLPNGKDVGKDLVDKGHAFPKKPQSSSSANSSILEKAVPESYLSDVETSSVSTVKSQPDSVIHHSSKTTSTVTSDEDEDEVYVKSINAFCIEESEDFETENTQDSDENVEVEAGDNKTLVNEKKLVDVDSVEAGEVSDDDATTQSSYSVTMEMVTTEDEDTENQAFMETLKIETKDTESDKESEDLFEKEGQLSNNDKLLVQVVPYDNSSQSDFGSEFSDNNEMDESDTNDNEDDSDFSNLPNPKQSFNNGNLVNDPVDDVSEDLNDDLNEDLNESENTRLAILSGTVPNMGPYVISSFGLNSYSNMLVTISHVESIHEFYAQVMSNSNMLDEMDDKIRTYYGFYENDDTFNLTNAQPYMACCVRYKDGFWYRGLVIAILPNDIHQVFYVDFGNTELVKGGGNLKKLYEKFVEHPVMSLRCTLETCNHEWSADHLFTKYFKEITLGKTLNSHVVLCEDQLFTLKLTDPEQGGIYGQLVKRIEQAEDSDMQNEEADAIIEFETVPSVYKDFDMADWSDLFNISVTHVDRPDIVYIQNVKSEPTEDPWQESINNQLNGLETLSWEMSHKHHTFGRFSNPKIGAACCAQYTEDDCWYRGEVICIRTFKSAALITVLFVDYGTKEEITIDRMCRLPVQYLSLPKQAVRCKVGNLAPNGKIEWPPEVFTEAQHLFANKVFHATVADDTVTPLKIEIYDQLEEGKNKPKPAYMPLIVSGMARLASPHE